MIQIEPLRIENFADAEALSDALLAPDSDRPAPPDISVATSHIGVIAETLVARRQSALGQGRLLSHGADQAVGCFRAALKQADGEHPEISDAMGVLRILGHFTQAGAHGCEALCLGASAALTSLGVGDQSRQRLLGTIGELIDNVYQHAGGAESALAAFQLVGRDFRFTVADAGQGILAGYRQTGLFDHVTDAHTAIELALQHTTSRFGVGIGRGQGFKNLLTVLRSLDASIRVRSDDACLESELRKDGQFGLVIREKPQLNGFVITCVIRCP